jgi:TrpR-related protein YerC/YecD
VAKVKPHKISKANKEEAIFGFFDVIEKLRNKKEMLDFFLGLLTSSEALMLARRIQVAQMLINDKGYEEIQKELKVGSQTISKIDRWINSNDEKFSFWLKKTIKKKLKENNVSNNSSNSLLRKYPAHRIWSDLFQ